MSRFSHPSRAHTHNLKILVLLSCLAFACTSDPSPESPYSGQETRQIKALSSSQIDGLLNGAGMGYAKVAELNGLPGPKHVLELGNELELTENQRSETEMIFVEMQEQAKALGSELVGVEKELDQLFSGAAIDTVKARDTMVRAAQLQAELRWTHVRAHLSQSEILTQKQRGAYIKLRGYEHVHDQSSDHDGDHSHEM